MLRENCLKRVGQDQQIFSSSPGHPTSNQVRGSDSVTVGVGVNHLALRLARIDAQAVDVAFRLSPARGLHPWSGHLS